jgi:hypothetical protein
VHAVLVLALVSQMVSGTSTLDIFSGSETELTRFVGTYHADAYFDFGSAGLEIALYDPGALKLYQRRTQAVKRYFGWDMGPVEARLGTFHAAFGRGIVLNATTDEAVAADRFLDGVSVRAEVGPLDGRFIAGTPRSYLYYNLADSTGNLRGVDVTLSTLADLGFSYVYLEKPLAGGISIVRKLGSLRLSKSIGPLELYVEGARIGDDPEGTAVYGSASFFGPGFSVTGEYKYYDAFGYALSVPPTVNHYGTYLNQAQDEQGFEVSADVFPLDDLFLRADVSRSWASDKGPFQGGEMNEAYVEATYYFESLELTLDVDYLDMKHVTAIEPTERLEINPHLTALLELPADMAVEAGVRARRREDDDIVYTDYDLSLTWFKFPWVDLSGAYEFRQGDLEGDWSRVTVRLHLGGQYDLEATYGSQRQDLVCSGGVCRFEPEFDGLRIKVTGRF